MGIALKEYITGAGFDFDPILDGEFHRFKPSGRRDSSGWYIGAEISNPVFKEPLLILNFGDWATGEIHKYISKKRFDEAQKSVKNKELDRIKKITEDKKIELRAEAKNKCVDFFSKAIPVVNHEYLSLKKVKPFGIYQDGPELCIPIYHSFNKSDVRSCQNISHDGFKKFMTNGEMLGGFFWIDGSIDKIFICEGYATGASIHEATGNMVVICFTANNLKKATDKTVSKFKNSEIIICADDDKFNKENAGIKGASKASADYGLKIKIPKFKNEVSKPTDFNDLMLLEGVDELRSQLLDDSCADIDIEVDDRNLKTEYKYFEAFYKKYLKNAVREKLSREFKIKDDFNLWQPVVSGIKSLKSKAHQNGLNHHFADIHLAEYTNKQPFKLLIHPKKWDGKERLLSIFSRFKFNKDGLDPDSCWFLFKEWCANIFRRIDDPQSQNRILIFRGDQGIGKDYFVENVIGKALGPYFINMEPLESNKENFMSIHGKLLANISEFDQTNKMAVSSIKNLITANRQRIRMPYEPSAKDYDFHCSFFASCNFDSILRDTSGNRRFIIFDIDEIRKGYEDLIDSEQILAEMYQWFLDDFRADKSCYDALDKFIQSETPDNPDDLALEMAILAIEGKEKFATDRKVSYADIEDQIIKIAKNLGISVFRVQNVIKRNGLQKRNDKMRYYTTEDFS